MAHRSDHLAILGDGKLILESERFCSGVESLIHNQQSASALSILKEPDRVWVGGIGLKIRRAEPR